MNLRLQVADNVYTMASFVWPQAANQQDRSVGHLDDSEE